MQQIALILILAVLSSVLAATIVNPLSDAFIDAINKKQSLWKAGKNFHPDTPRSYLQSLLGLKKGTKTRAETIHHKKDTDIPDSFDSREKWSSCKYISRIYDQSKCGSCWAVATASAMTDRVCIHSNYSQQPLISARNIISCCTDCGEGCFGGWPLDAWTYWITTGIVTGGAYNTTEGCQNYPLPHCEHHGTAGQWPACGEVYVDTPECPSTCDEGTNLEYKDSFTYGRSTYMVENDEEQIQLEILKNGPVVSDFQVYYDFFSYKSGIYRRTTDDKVAGHVVRVLGWGIENDVKYWLMANSWNEDWGDNGTFKIIRGQNECGLEEGISTGFPKL